MSKRGHRRPTLADVAERSGMSKAAVSLILNDRPGSRLSAETAERVRRAAAELGYRPDPAAQSLRLGKTRSIGFISDDVTLTRYASGMIRGVLDAARQRSHTVLMAETGGDISRLGEAFEALVDRRVDGIVVGLLGARQIDLPTAPARVPVVIVNGRTSADHPSVLPDERTAGYAMAKVLTDAGHRSIGFIGDVPRVLGNPRLTVTVGERFEGINDAFEQAGVVSTRVDVEDWQPIAGYEHAHGMLAAHPDITAFLTGNDNVAFGVYQALAELGLRVPDDISVASFDDDELAGYQRPGLTTARLPYEEMARRGVEMLLGDRDPTHDLVPMPVVHRASVAPPGEGRLTAGGPHRRRRS